MARKKDDTKTLAMHRTHKKKKKPASKSNSKVKVVMDEWKEGKLHSGSKKGPKVTNQKQAVAIALSEARKAGEKVKPKRKKK